MDKKTMEKVINGMAEKLEKYIDNTNKELKTLGIYKDDRCDNYPVIESLIKLNKKVDSLENDIKTLNNKISGLQWDTAQDTNKLNGRFDDLEAKNYQIKSDLDKLINYMETEPIIDELTTKGGNNE